MARWSPQRKIISWKKIARIAGLLLAVIAVAGLSAFLYFRFRTRSPAPPPAEVTNVLVPRDLGGRVTQPALLKLMDVASKQDLNRGRLTLVARDGGRSSSLVFPIGQSFEVEASSTNDCHYAVLHHDSDGAFQLLYPAPDSSGNNAILPKNSSVFLAVHALPPGGRQEFILICAEGPIKLQSVLDGKPESYAQQLAVALLPYVAPQK